MSDYNETKMYCVELREVEAWALAQFLKPTTHQDCRKVATTDTEAYLMMDGLNTLLRGLAEEGVNPR